MNAVKKIKKNQAVDREVMLIDEVSFELQEAYKTLRTNLQFLNADSNLKKLLITSCGPLEGKTTVSVNLSISLAQAGYKTLLIDSDLRKPRVHKTFGTFSTPGLTNILAQGLDYNTVKRHESKYNIDYITSGPIPPNPAELLGSAKMKDLLNTLCEVYDYIIFDTPPSLFISDAATLSKLMDGVLLVCSSGSVTFDMMRKLIENLSNAGANIIGTILNNVDLEKKGRAYYSKRYRYYDYYYYHKHRSTDKDKSSIAQESETQQ